MTDEERFSRIERALVDLRRGVDWSAQRGGSTSEALRALVAEVDELDAAAAEQRRQEQLAAELASLKRRAAMKAA